jgi:uncharacterized protein YcbX
MQIQSIHRFVMKAFQGESLSHSELIQEGSIPNDRAFAFMYTEGNSTQSIDPHLKWIKKTFLVNQRDWPDCARFKATLSNDAKVLHLQSDSFSESCELADPKSRKMIAECFFEQMKSFTPFENSRNPEVKPLTLLGSPSLTSRFTDGETPPLSIGFYESLTDFEKHFGKAIEKDRMRLNVWIDGGHPWLENEIQPGQILSLGSCELESIKPIGRCPNIDVHPTSGARDAELYEFMKPKFGHSVLGLKCRVLKGGMIHVGDSFKLL